MSPPEPPRSLVGFNPGREAEPTSQESTEEENPAPSVLNKLQKWVGAGSGSGGAFGGCQQPARSPFWYPAAALQAAA
jgi:hypothetical protein